MAKLSRIKTGQELSLKISALGNNARTVAESALKAGAAVVADEVRRGIGGVPIKTGVTKHGLEAGLGVSPIRDNNGVYDVKVGFEGYNERSMPNAMMARIVESGTSKTPKHPFVRPAIRRAKDQAVKAMEDAADKEIEKIMKG